MQVRGVESEAALEITGFLQKATGRVRPLTAQPGAEPPGTPVLTVCGIEKAYEQRDLAAAALLTALAWIVVLAAAATAVVRRSIRPAQAEG